MATELEHAAPGRAVPVAAAPMIGVLALQGDVTEHVKALEALGVAVVEIRLPRDLVGVDALVLPGGESTTLQLLIEASGLRPVIAERLAAGMPVLGTCAGMILLAATVLDGRPDQWSFGAIDLAVRRNAFGRQIASFEEDLELAGIAGGPMHAVFIRAPVVETVGRGVEVIARVAMTGDGARPVACRQGRVTVTAFHPELVGDRRFHELLVADAGVVGGR
ncbi:MAG TPA: pyridoxal 5'-phosphate synthase glutaminase subunit PdxT [Acidimicrobiales bacterium]|nr:pyridoxal 5'-phosphate synthase glutaminase subunit PdxT [Acidimicrobiales bacterium]